MMQFMKATKKQSKLRLALIGPSGSGKTYTALILATALGGKVAVIDTERGSASKYSDLFAFDVLELTTFSPLTYVEAIHAAEQADYDILIIDSLSHAWIGKDGALEQVDKFAKRSQSQNSFAAWRDVTPMHNALVDAMLQSSCHVIGTMRTKTEYVIEQNEKGKNVPRKVGLAPVQRDGLEYEFDIVGDMDLDNTFVVSKTRCSALHGAVITKPDAKLAGTLKAWITDGAKPEPLMAKPGPAAPVTRDLPVPVPPTPAHAQFLSQQMVKIGKNKYPAEWGKAFVPLYATVNAFEIDGILQKLQMPDVTSGELAVNAVNAYLFAKREGNDNPTQDALDYYNAALSGTING